MTELNIQFKKLHPDAQCPTKTNFTDAGWDLYAVEDCRIWTGRITKIPTGIAVAIPDGHVGLLWDRSGLSIKHGVHRVAGVIDAGYRGEIIVGLGMVVGGWHDIKKGDRIAQLLIQEVPLHITWEEVEKLDETSRGQAGFGNSGR